MIKLLKALKNEMLKIFKSKKLYIVLVILFLYQLLMAYGTSQLAKEEIMFGFISGLSFPLFFLSESISSLILLFCIVLISGAISDENNEGTLKLSLIRPITRNEFFTAKIISSFLLILFMLTITFFTALLSGVLFLGLEGNFYYSIGQEFSKNEGLIKTIFYYIFSLFPLAGFSMIIIFFSNIFKKTSLTITSSIGVLFLFQIISVILEKSKIFIITNHLDISKYIFQEIDKDFYSSFFVILGYIIIFSAINFVYFNKKDILN